MTAEPKSWLPLAAAGEVENALRRAAVDWLARWVAAPPASLEVAAVPSDAQAYDLVALGAVACAHRGDLRNPADRGVFERVGQAMLDDLITCLAGPSPHGPDPSDKPARYSLRCAEQGWSICIDLTADEAIAMRKRASGPARPVRLGPLTDALADKSVSLGCHLGRAGLTAAEVGALGVGDLIVFDRKLNDPLPLTVAGVVCAGGAASLDQSDENFTVRLESTIDLATK